MHSIQLNYSTDVLKFIFFNDFFFMERGIVFGFNFEHNFIQKIWREQHKNKKRSKSILKNIFDIDESFEKREFHFDFELISVFPHSHLDSLLFLLRTNPHIKLRQNQSQRVGRWFILKHIFNELNIS